MAGMTPTPAATPPDAPAAPATVYPPEVEAFCAEHGLREHLDTAVRIAREVYPAMLGCSTEVVDDPDSPESWVTIRVVVPPGVLGDGRTTWEYAGREARAIPADVAGLIRLAPEVG